MILSFSCDMVTIYHAALQLKPTSYLYDDEK